MNNPNKDKNYRDYRPLYKVEGPTFRAKSLTNEEINKLVQSSGFLSSPTKKNTNKK